MIPLATAIPAAIPLPLEMNPGMIPALVLLVFLALGVFEVARAAFTQGRRAPRGRIAPTPMRVAKRAVAA
jgi:hypothetical protein